MFSSLLSYLQKPSIQSKMDIWKCIECHGESDCVSGKVQTCNFFLQSYLRVKTFAIHEQFNIISDKF